MKNNFRYFFSAICFACIVISCNNNISEENISFYQVPLVCGADSSIGCGSRIKPLFIETSKEKTIKESWINRRGTVIAIVWKGTENEKLIQSIFENNFVEAKLIVDSTEVKTLSAGFRKNGKWLQGMEVDQLSIQEAGTIAVSATKFAQEKGLITEEEASAIKNDIEEYFKKELVKVRTYDELKSEATTLQWRKYKYDIYVKHIGEERADKARELFREYQEEIRKSKDKCCKKGDGENLQSEITCPKCLHKKNEKMPTDVCLLKYTCENCKADLFPHDGDCCVFCSYGSVKCPSKQ